MKLTKTLVEAARPRAQRYRLNDSLVPGLCLLVLPSGALGKSSMVCHTGCTRGAAHSQNSTAPEQITRRVTTRSKRPD
jgi:hypothetical protein